MGLMPMPAPSKNWPPISSLRNFIHLGGFGRAGLAFDAGVHVFGVLAEDDHVHSSGSLDRAGDAGVLAHRPHAGVQVEHLAQGDVQAAEAAADRRGERAFDGHDELAQRVEGLLGHVVAAVQPAAFSPA